MRSVSFAQKALLLDAVRTSILMVPYNSAKYTASRVNGRYGLPGVVVVMTL